ncbi:MAG: polysaccharide deacetylase family protein [Bacteroidales bacterium]
MVRQKIVLYSTTITPRLNYIATHILTGLLGADLVFTGYRQEAISAAVPVISYSPEHISGAVNILPCGLLHTTGKDPLDVVPTMCDGIPVLFLNDGNYDTGFDVLAASFFMLSRYEEYLPFRRDSHGRFTYKVSMACKFQLSDLPLVDMWACELQKAILNKYPRVLFPERKFSFIPTIDIDVPWAYKNKGFGRTFAGFGVALAKLQMQEFSNRYRVLFGKNTDPYDTYSDIYKIHDQAGLTPVFFFSPGTYGRYDKSAAASNSGYRRLVRYIGDKYPAGVHPSYYSYNDRAIMSGEIQRFREMSGIYPVKSRQHYLRLELPVTYRLLIDNGIREDYTMGWPDMPGFRAGTSTPFLFYDLELEKTTALKVWPLHIMDGTLRDYLKLDKEQAFMHSDRIIKKVRRYGGTLVTLWHNESFSGKGRWKDWKNLYLDIIKSAVT